MQQRAAAIDSNQISDAQQGKDVLIGFINAVDGDTASVLSGVEAAGVPAVTNGAAVAQAITGAFERLRGVMDKVVTRTNDLPTDSLQSFSSAAATLTGSVRSAMNGIAGDLKSATKSPTLHAAALADPACVNAAAG